MSERPLVTEDKKPSFAPHVRFSFDEKRACWIILAPERLLMPDEIAVEVFKLCTGEATAGEIIDDLSERFDAPRDAVSGDVIELVQDMIDKGFMVL
jgi:pyrroloquinoline quinone biosynthesis protein D